MATVYLCTDSRTQAKVAVKVLRRELGSAVIVERFVREIEFASELDHRRVPKVLDSGVWGETPFYVMTYIEGESLRQRLDRVKQLPVDEAVSITTGVIEPMSYAHGLGIMHRDIKPGNILIGLDGVYVLDFGIARAIIASAEDRLTSTGIALGTPAYMSPEQALADHDLDARSDIYSLACVTYEMIAGLPPFVGATPQAVMARRFASPPPPLRETREGVPEHVEFAVAKALSRAPADRWQTAKEFSEALSSPRFAESIHDLQSKVDRRRRKYGRVIAGIVSIAIVAAVVFATSAARGDQVSRAQKLAASWDFESAERELHATVSKNPKDARAQLWLAQMLMLRGAPIAEWKRFTIEAETGRQRLDSSDLLRLTALTAFASGDFSAACPRFGSLTASAANRGRTDPTRSLAFADCLRLDSAIVPDASSPTGFRFRASFHFVDSIYRALLDRHGDDGRAYDAIAPRLKRVLPVDNRALRRGKVVGPDRGLMYALPAIIGDSLAFIPYRLPAGGGHMTFGEAKSLASAILENQQKLRDVAAAWVRVAPDNSDAHEMLAQLLEAAGELDGKEHSAIAELLVARASETKQRDTSAESVQRRLRLGDAHVRVLVRLGRYEEAGLIADSLLAIPEPREMAEELSVNVNSYYWRLAALRGRIERVIVLERRYASRLKAYLPTGPEPVPPKIGVDVIALNNYAAFGGPRDSIVIIAKRISDMLPAVVAPRQLDAFRMALLGPALASAAPSIGPDAVTRLGSSMDPMRRALAAYARGNRRMTRALLDTLADLRADNAPGQITMDVTFHEAWLMAAIGDTAAATKRLDDALAGITKAPPSMLSSPLLIASLVRCMLLRSLLAESQGDSRVSTQWASAARSLWGRGDPFVIAEVNRSRQQ